jgi:hypothetical protein
VDSKGKQVQEEPALGDVDVNPASLEDLPPKLRNGLTVDSKGKQVQDEPALEVFDVNPASLEDLLPKLRNGLDGKSNTVEKQAIVYSVADEAAHLYVSTSLWFILDG